MSKRFKSKYAPVLQLEACISMAALAALLVACGSGSRQPAPPAAAPTPTVQPKTKTPSAPDLEAKPKTSPKDSVGSGNYPWQSGPIATL